MKEIRVAQKLQISHKDKQVINGSVVDYTFDRIMIKVNAPDVAKAQDISELDEVSVAISTHMGIKHMTSCVISELDKNNCIVIENNDAAEVEQKRQFVRVVSNLHFIIEFNSNIVNCTAINISAGGIAFSSKGYNFKVNDKIKIKFSENDLGKNITCDAIIIKAQHDIHVAKYVNMSPYDEDKIMKYVFKLMTLKK